MKCQSGFGRTGAMFASERYGIEPDLLVTAKSLRRWIAAGRRNWARRDHGRPRSGRTRRDLRRNPLSCAAALAVLDLFEREKSSRPRQRAGGPAFKRRAASGSVAGPSLVSARLAHAGHRVSSIAETKAQQPRKQKKIRSTAMSTA